MNVVQESVALSAVLFIALLGALHVGRRIGLRRLARDPDGARTGTGIVEAAVLALLGLLIAFSFTDAARRFDARRSLVAEEANAVGTAWKRLDLLPADSQPALRDIFRRYVDARLEVHRALPDLQAADLAELHVEALQAEAWTLGLAAGEKDGRLPLAALVLSSFNEMFDCADTRMAAAHMHVPGPILGTLLVLALLAALLAGYAMATPRSHSRLHALVFAFVMALTIYVIVDLEHPRAGLIRMDAADRPLIVLLEAMREGL